MKMYNEQNKLVVLMEFFEESVLIFSNFLKIQDNTGQILQIQDKFGNTGQFLKIQDIQDTLNSLIVTNELRIVFAISNLIVCVILSNWFYLILF